MKGFSSEKLRFLIIWLPVLQSDDRDDAINASQELQNRRVQHYWSSEKKLGNMFSEILEIDQLAWDVYMVFESGVIWADSVPSKPVFWTHQLGELENGVPTLDTTVLREKIQILMR